MSKLSIAVGRQDHVRGSPKAPMTLVEYGDFECPYCGRAYGILRDIEGEMGPQLCVVFRHFPLASIHPHAEAAALAAEAAGAQGRFWEMHDALYENQNALDDDDLLRYAEALDLEPMEFEKALRAATFLLRIKEDFMSGVRSGVNGTPTFFINGERHEGSYEYPVLIRALREAAEIRAAR
jgi:protein-disulfide isomerase